MFETNFSEALKFIKVPKINIWKSFQKINNNDALNNNEEVYDFTNSFFVTERVFDTYMINKITIKLKTNRRRNDDKKDGYKKNIEQNTSDEVSKHINCR